MTEHDPGQGDNFDRLIANRAEIADFVNSFTSERVQRKAFAAVVCSLGLSDSDASTSHIEPLHLVQNLPDSLQLQEPTDDEPIDLESGSNQRRRRGRNGSKKTFTVPRGLNFAPEGHQSLEQFVAQKEPRTHPEKFLVACHYLQNMMSIPDVEIGHILAVYRAAEWKAPAHPDSALRAAASHTDWIDTSNTKSIKVVWKGENHLAKMPIASKKESS